MALQTDELRRVGIQLSVEEFERAVREALSQMAPAPRVSDPRQELTSEEASALERGGLCLDPVATGQGDDPVVQAVAHYAALLAASLTVNQAAAMLGVAPSRIRQRLAARTLYGIKTRDGWRLPQFQFDDGRTVPGIEAGEHHLDPDLHPLGVYNWFTLPDPDFEIDDQPVSPRDWLRSGGSTDQVAALAADI